LLNVKAVPVGVLGLVLNHGLDNRDRGLADLAIHPAQIFADDAEEHRIYADGHEDESGKGSEASEPLGMQHDANKGIAELCGSGP